MAKHTLHKDKQDLLGQYMTVNADTLLESYKWNVYGRTVIDPCAGHGDLLSWAWRNGAADCEGYDIEPKGKDKFNDMFVNPIDCTDKVVVTNPPYLSKNRADDKTAYERWEQNDLYKCYLATLVESNVNEAIIIQPSNFLFESNAKARTMFFENFEITHAEYWQEVTFPGVAISIMTMSIVRRKENKEHTKFYITNKTTNKKYFVTLEKEKKYLFSPDELDTKDYIKFEKVEVGMKSPNSNIIISLLDKGTYGLGFAYNEGEALFTKKSSFTTYQINTPTLLSEDKQRELIKIANKKLKRFRKKYDSMFLSNYIACNQKILSKTIANKILTLAWQEIN